MFDVNKFLYCKNKNISILVSILNLILFIWTIFLMLNLKISILSLISNFILMSFLSIFLVFFNKPIKIKEDSILINHMFSKIEMGIFKNYFKHKISKLFLFLLYIMITVFSSSLICFYVFSDKFNNNYYSLNLFFILFFIFSILFLLFNFNFFIENKQIFFILDDSLYCNKFYSFSDLADGIKVNRYDDTNFILNFEFLICKKKSAKINAVYIPISDEFSNSIYKIIESINKNFIDSINKNIHIYNNLKPVNYNLKYNFTLPIPSIQDDDNSNIIYTDDYTSSILSSDDKIDF